jgi:uncharacterized protein YyaL (SSP411 family)
MAFGGIYDQLVADSPLPMKTGWLFWKMLYDNAQLVSLYSHAYQSTKKSVI